MDYITAQELQAAVNEVKASITELFTGISDLRPHVSNFVDEEDAKNFADNALDTWVDLNKETIDILKEAMVELQVENYPGTFIDKIMHLIEGMELLLASINHNCANPVPIDATFDQWKDYIVF